ncbi:MAG: class I SAM-dependent methyltransferase [Pseudomonadota bacterium]
MTTPHTPHRQNPLLRLSYSLIAPLYDYVIERPMRSARCDSLTALPDDGTKHVLISGAGTGLDLPHLPAHHRYTALDFNAGMLARARARKTEVAVDFVLGDSMALPFADAQFDHVVLHLIVAVVPEPQRVLSEAARVLKPGGTILLFDKFLQPGQRAPLRRLLNPLSRRLATRMDVVFEEVLRAAPELHVVCDEAALAGGWFRRILLQK